MDRISRTVAPNCLTTMVRGKKNYKRKGILWANRYNGTNASSFSWGRFRNRNLNHILVEELQLISEKHCFYCDKKGILKGDCTPTIDHFVPKTLKPLLAYFWNNLFLCCNECQSYKSNVFSKNLLKFDRINYTFDDYYLIDFATGKIEVRPDINQSEKDKAQYTLDILGINKDARPSIRIEETNAFNQSSNNNYDDFSYRFYLQRI